MKHIILLALIAICASSCTTKRIITENIIYQHDTLTKYKTISDTLIAHDSVYIEEYLKGDTVYMSTYKYKSIYKPRYVHDSIYICQRDTVKVSTTQVASKKWYDKVVNFIGWVVVMALIIVIAYMLFVYLYKSYIDYIKRHINSDN